MKKKHSIIVVALLIVTFLVVNAVKENSDLKENGIESTAEVVNYRYVEYIDNEESHKLIQFHTISYFYKYDDKSYTETDELSPAEYEKMFTKSLGIGDTVSIILSSEHPENSILTK